MSKEPHFLLENILMFHRSQRSAVSFITNHPFNGKIFGSADLYQIDLNAVASHKAPFRRMQASCILIPVKRLELHKKLGAVESSGPLKRDLRDDSRSEEWKIQLDHNS